MALDPIHGEIFVPREDRVLAGRYREDKILVFPRDADGDVAPIRVLGGPDTGLRVGRVTVDPINNVLIASGNGLRIFDRTASGNTKPRAVISGGGGLMTTYPPKGLIFARMRGGGGGGPSIGVWSIHDNGDVPPMWTIGKGVFREIRGVAIDPQNQVVMVTDKGLNAILTFHVPEIFE